MLLIGQACLHNPKVSRAGSPELRTPEILRVESYSVHVANTTQAIQEPLTEYIPVPSSSTALPITYAARIWLLQRQSVPLTSQTPASSSPQAAYEFHFIDNLALPGSFQ